MRRWIRLGLDVVLPRDVPAPAIGRCPPGRPPRSAPRVGLRSSSRSRVRARAAAVPHRPGGTCASCVHAPPRLHRRARARTVSSRRPAQRPGARGAAAQVPRPAGQLAAPLGELLAEHYPLRRRRPPRPGPAAPVAAARPWLQPGAAARTRPRAPPAPSRRDPRLLVRTRATPEQAELDAAARRTNVRGAFALAPRREARAPHRRPGRRRPHHRRHGRRVCARAARRRRPAACTSTPSAGHRDASACGRTPGWLRDGRDHGGRADLRKRAPTCRRSSIASPTARSTVASRS